MNKFSRRKFLKTSVAITAGALVDQHLSKAPGFGSSLIGSDKMSKPNLLFIFCDQLRYSALGCDSNDTVQTPYIDRLANEGVVFDQAFSSCPLCSPFRGQLLTGRFSHINGVVDNEYALKKDQVTFPQILKKQGYRTGFVGKWHLGYGPYTEDKRHGFDYLAAHNCIHEYYNLEYYENAEGPIKIKEWSPAGMTSIALKFIDNYRKSSKDKPFALFLGWGPPHYPYDQYPKEFQVYNPDKVDLPPNVPEEFESFARKVLADYYGNMTALDVQLKRIIDYLDLNGLADKTIVCFTSDHGDHLLSHGYLEPTEANWRWMHPSLRASKGTPYDESIHIPFILRWPEKIKGGRRVSTMMSSVDFMPTLLSLMGLNVPVDVQGLDLSHAIRGEEGIEPESVYLQLLGPGWPHRGKWVGHWRGIRAKRYMYARWHANEYGPFLFDREKDPYEMNNLLWRNPYKKSVPDDWEERLILQEKMESLLQDWIKKTNDPFDTGERDPKTGMLCLGQKFTHDKYKW
jgi:arylsulfatase A-like enzyme